MAWNLFNTNLFAVIWISFAKFYEHSSKLLFSTFQRQMVTMEAVAGYTERPKSIKAETECWEPIMSQTLLLSKCSTS